MEREGLVKSKLVEYDEQSSALHFRWSQNSTGTKGENTSLTEVSKKL
jgi:hypothetical protein